MSKRAKFEIPVDMSCNWCGKKKSCLNNAQVEHFKRCYPRGRTYKNNGELVNADNAEDCYILCYSCIPLVKRYLALVWIEQESYKQWLQDFKEVDNVFI